MVWYQMVWSSKLILPKKNLIEILVSQFVKQTEIKDKEFMDLCQSEWQTNIDEIVSSTSTKWFTRTQYNRKDPALATFC
jgi:hypothetical protein